MRQTANNLSFMPFSLFACLYVRIRGARALVALRG
jgi:hypothetical protein